MNLKDLNTLKADLVKFNLSLKEMNQLSTYLDIAFYSGAVFGAEKIADIATSEVIKKTPVQGVFKDSNKQ